MESKKIWLLQTWEPNPLDDPNARPWRTGMLANHLVKSGCEVTWWASSFAHNLKSFRGSGKFEHQVAKNFTIRLIPALGYKRHVSMERLRDHRFVAQSWLSLVQGEEKPDLIIASYPTIELCEVAVAWANDHNVPIIVDIRDQYPDLYWENAPSISKSIVKLLCRGMQKKARKIFAHASAITANGPDVVNWGLTYGGRAKTENDRDFPMSYTPPELSPMEEQEAEQFLANQMVNFPSDTVIIAYTGMIGQTIDLEPIWRAASELADLPRVQFVFAGGGDALEESKIRAAQYGNVHFTGWLDSAKIHVLLKKSHMGLVPYRSRANFETGITNKPVEYLAHGLPILTSLQRGPIVDMIRENGCGWTYKNDVPNDLSNQIKCIVETDKFNQMVNPAKSLFESTFHPDSVYARWMDLIEKVIYDSKS
jgi:glycosyltransferase involved in cell wall biosynthesis